MNARIAKRPYGFGVKAVNRIFGSGSGRTTTMFALNAIITTALPPGKGLK
jgi:hypothetical protein